jgi:serine phosphatase RsbU (regulator of sigma subunit)
VGLRKSTRILLAILAGTALLLLIDGPSDRLGAPAPLIGLVAIVAGIVLAWRALSWGFRLVVHRLTLRLAFSYFLIGIVPIPLLAALLFAVGYLLAHEFIATRLRNEVDTLAEVERVSGASIPRIRLGADDRIVSSDVPWLASGDTASWAARLSEPRPVVGGGQVWIAVRPEAPEGTVELIPIGDRSAPWLQRLADRTGFAVTVELGSAQESSTGFQVRVDPDRRRRQGGADQTLERRFVRPRPEPPKPEGWWDREFLAGVYVERPVAVVGEVHEKNPVVAFVATTSPAVLNAQLSAQGVPEVQRIVRVILIFLMVTLLCVYLVALLIAFVLVGTIVRNVNRLTRATQAVARGDFSVRVDSKSRDQIGDLARSYDQMAASIERLLQETARKEKIEAELAVAKAIQQSFLPESEGRWKGFQAAAHFEPAAELGGDYYDVLPMPDGRTAVFLGDVSGHGLATALVSASTRATLVTLVEMGVGAGEAFGELEHRRERSRDKEGDRRLYTTLVLFAYDAARRLGTLTNAGHPAPYRLSDGGVERLELPALPIGLLPGRSAAWPSKEYAFAPGDRLVLFTDGIVEACNAAEEPWGYERFEALLAQGGRRSAPELIASILGAVAAHVGSTPLEDDRTLLVLTFDAP